MAHAMNRRALSTVLALVAMGCGGPGNGPSADADRDDAGAPGAVVGVTPEAGDALDRDVLVAALERGEVRTVLVLYEAPADALGGGASDPRVAIAEVLAPGDVVFAANTFPVLAVRVHDVASLARLEALHGVLRVEPERMHETGSPSLDLIHAADALAVGANGEGTSVAVVDTGVDYTRVELGSCTGVGTPASCAVPYAHDFAPSDGALDAPERHGTNVASIVRSVAPSARILALDVFSGPSASSVDIAAAIDWIVTNRAAYGIVAANFSLGYGAFTAPCSGDVLAVAMQRLRDAGVVPVVATGNAGATNAISSPACGPASVSVGAVDGSTGAVASFSNAASFQTLLAPGVYVSGGGVVMSGTSQATPHVSGAVAALRTLFPAESIDDLVLRLRTTGAPTTDARNGLVIPRLDVGAASAGGDGLPPTGTLTLPAWTRTTSVPFTLVASDPSGVASMCVTTATTCTTFVPYASSGTITVATGAGTKTVRAWLRDTLGHTSPTPLVATVGLDTTAPTNGAVVATSGVHTVALSWSRFADAGSGIARYRVVAATGASAPTTCTTGTTIGETDGTTLVHTGGTDGTTYRYRVCALDVAGNLSTGATASAMPVGELDPPTDASVIVAGDAAWTRTTTVSVALAATDATGVTQMCVSTSATCTAWRALASPTTVSLPTGTGTRTVYARFRDAWGNTTATPAMDSIGLDTTMPPTPVVTATAGSQRVTLAWPDVVDVGSGLDHYLVRTAAGTTPTTCTGGTSLGLDGSAPRSFSASGTGVIGWRVCAVDLAGNVSTGRTGLTTPLR